MEAEEYFQDQVAGRGSSLYYSLMSAEPPQRAAVTALHALSVELRRIADESGDPHLALIKLQWWREEIGRLFRGEPQHPITRGLTGPVGQLSLPQEHFVEVIDGFEMDLTNTTYDSYRDLALYCHRVSGIVELMAAEIFGYQERSTTKYANELGIALQLTAIVRNVRSDAGHGRIYLPLDEMDRFGVSRQQIFQGVATDGFGKLMAFQAQRAREHYQRALGLLPAVDRYAQRSGLVMANIQQKLLDEIEGDGFRVLEHRVTLTPLRMFWIAWTTTRRERRQQQRHPKA